MSPCQPARSPVEVQSTFLRGFWGGGGARGARLAGRQLRPCCGVMGCFLCWKALFQSLERLEKEKADKEDLVLGIDVVWPREALVPRGSRAG